ncbi:MAG: protein kinase [Anaerolineales bacterium]|jgi:DNA-binding NarL/FixJ family response regulator
MVQKMVAQRFQIETLIGGGAIGSVYRGTDTLTGEQVAIKVLRKELTADMPELIERFRREGEALRRLNHPNIVRMLGMVEEQKQHYLIMEYVGGGSLAGLLKRQPQLPLVQAVAIALELADALSRAHHLEILHRDIKPDNILLAEDGAPRLTDFGLARLGNYPSITTAGSVLGTFQYLSPEAFYDQVLDSRADIWSLGVVLYEMLAGQVPFSGGTPGEILWAINNQPLPDPSRWREDIPATLVELLKNMLMRDRPLRIASARQVGAELEKIQKGMQRPGGSPLSEPGPGQFEQASASFEAQPPSPKKIRVLIVDDHAVVRQGLRTFIDLQEDMQVVGEGSNGVEAVELAERFQPDVILLDLAMPQMDGLEATRKILESSPHTQILILTSFGEDDKVFPAIRAGAQGYLLKDVRPNDLVQAVRQASQGKAQLHPEIAKKLMSAVAAERETPESAPQVHDSAADLTERELEVLRWIATGLNNREIAEKLVISEKTVKTHVSNLLGKLSVGDRTQAAIWALKHGLGAED